MIARRVLAILAGFAAVVVLSVGADAALEMLGVFPTDPAAMSAGMFALATAYRAAFTLIGGAVTARLSPRPDQRDVQILAGIGFVAGLAGVVAWAMTPGLGPLWYALAIPVTGVLCTLIGGRLAR